MRKHFLTGLVILLPLVVTIFVIAFLIDFFTLPFIGIVSNLLYELNFAENGFLLLTREQVVRYLSQAMILVALFIATMLLGMITRWFLFKTLFNLGDSILHRIPLVNTVYKTTQEITRTLFASDKNSFKQVVIVPFPRPDIYVLGLISRESPEVCCRAVDTDLISVLVPTAPNPTTGFLLMLKRSQLIHIDMKPEDAIKYIVSCGVIVPHVKK